MTGAFQTIYVYTPEVYPTAVRGAAIGLHTSVARIGAMITPFVAQASAATCTMCDKVTSVTHILCSGCVMSQPHGRKQRFDFSDFLVPTLRPLVLLKSYLGILYTELEPARK